MRFRRGLCLTAAALIAAVQFAPRATAAQFPLYPSGIDQFDPYGAFTGGTSVAAGNLTGDANEELATAAGPGGGPHVKVFEIRDATRAHEFSGFFAYGESFRGGVSVAVGDVDGNGTDEIVTGAGPAEGGAPHVRIWRVNLDKTVTELGNGFFAYGLPFAGGVNVAVANVDGDTAEEVITGPAQFGGPHVKVFDVAPSSFEATQRGPGFFAYDVEFNGGVRVAAGDVLPTAGAEIVTGAGRTGGSHVKVFEGNDDGHGSQAGPGFFAYGTGFTAGVWVAVGDVLSNPGNEVITGAGAQAGAAPHIRVFNAGGELMNNGYFAFGDRLGTGARVATIDGDAGVPQEIVAGMEATGNAVIGRDIITCDGGC